MDLRHLIFVLLFYQAAGFFLSMGVVNQDRMGHRYFLYHGLGATALSALALFILGPHPLRPYFGKAMLWFFGFSTFYALMAGRRWWLSTAFFAFGNVAALYIILADLLPQFPSGSALFPNAVYFVVNGLLSAGLLGFAMAAMLVGHWYLVKPKLSINELKKTTYVFLGLVLARFLFGSLTLFLLLQGRSEVEIYRYLFAGYPGLFVTMRWVWGLFGPLVLSYFIWNTVKIRSTQSATGILYVAVLFVLAGEILSQYLALYHGIAM